MEAVRLKSSSVGLSDRNPPSRSTLGIPGIVDIGAKPKKAWFDFWLTLLFIAFCQLVLISPSLCYLGYPSHTRLKQLVFLQIARDRWTASSGWRMPG
jgi:hypothetical protein